MFQTATERDGVRGENGGLGDDRKSYPPAGPIVVYGHARPDGVGGWWRVLLIAEKYPRAIVPGDGMVVVERTCSVTTTGT